eukprot:scaffold13622_cov107-Isochrysis_galbana.AAC.2
MVATLPVAPTAAGAQAWPLRIRVSPPPHVSMLSARRAELSWMLNAKPRREAECPKWSDGGVGGGGARAARARAASSSAAAARMAFRSEPRTAL